MTDQRNRLRMKLALVEPFIPPKPGLEQRALASLGHGRLRRANRVLALAAFAVFMVVAVSAAIAGHLLRPNPGPAGAPRHQVQVTLSQLRDRPLNLPQLGPGGRCIQTPLTLRHVTLNKGQTLPYLLFLWGVRGPINAMGGQGTIGSRGYYYHVTWLSEAKYNGIALIRGRRLDGPEQIVFAGPLATGQLVTTDTILGTSTRLYNELVLPAGKANPGGVWRQWSVYQGVPGPGCYAFQIDGPTFHDIIVNEVPPGG